MDRQLYYYAYVPRSAHEIVAALTGAERSVFSVATDSAVAEAKSFRERMHLEIAGLDIGRDVRIKVGDAREENESVFIPIEWHAASQASLFPSMHARLEVAALSHLPPWSQLGLLGHYRPPAGVIGAIGDVVLGHRVAEAAVRHFVNELASRLDVG